MALTCLSLEKRGSSTWPRIHYIQRNVTKQFDVAAVVHQHVDRLDQNSLLAAQHCTCLVGQAGPTKLDMSIPFHLRIFPGLTDLTPL